MEQPPLNDEELEKIRRMITLADNRLWLRKSLAGTATWIIAVAGGWFALKGIITEFLTWPRD